jgi:hypothetical protein
MAIIAPHPDQSHLWNIEIRSFRFCFLKSIRTRSIRQAGGACPKGWGPAVESPKIR